MIKIAKAMENVNPKLQRKLDLKVARVFGEKEKKNHRINWGMLFSVF